MTTMKKLIKFLIKVLTYNNKEVVSADVFGIGTFASSIWNSVAQGMTNRKQRKWSEQQAREEYDRNVNFWHMQNEYNNPTNQMARFEEAGLNPHLAISGGDPGNATTMPQYNRPSGDFKYSPINLPNMIESYQNFKLKKQNINNQEEIGNILANKAQRLSLENQLLSMKLNFQPEYYDYQRSSWVPKLQQERHKAKKYGFDKKISEKEWQIINHRWNWISNLNMDPAKDPLLYRWLGKGIVDFSRGLNDGRIKFGIPNIFD
jgi:hypothetical protein